MAFRKAYLLLPLCLVSAILLNVYAAVDPTGVYRRYLEKLAPMTPPVAAMATALADGVYPWSTQQANGPAPQPTPTPQPQPESTPEPEPAPVPNPSPSRNRSRSRSPNPDPLPSRSRTPDLLRWMHPILMTRYSLVTPIQTALWITRGCPTPTISATPG